MFRPEELARRLREIRMEMGLSQVDMAKKLGVSRGALCYYENGQRTPDIAFLCALHELSGCPMEYLTGMSEAKKRENVGISEKSGLNDKAIAWIRKNAEELNLTVDVAGDELGQAIMAAAVFAAENGIYASPMGLEHAALFERIWETAVRDMFDLCKITGYESISHEERAYIQELLQKRHSPKESAVSQPEEVKKTVSLLPTAAEAVASKQVQSLLWLTEREKNALLDELQRLDDIYRRSQKENE